MFGAIADGLITIVAGLVACYYGFRTPPATADWQRWHQTWGKWVKIGGVCLVLFGVFTIVSALF
jgi:hypothetical protein